MTVYMAFSIHKNSIWINKFAKGYQKNSNFDKKFAIGFPRMRFSSNYKKSCLNYSHLFIRITYYCNKNRFSVISRMSPTKAKSLLPQSTLIKDIKASETSNFVFAKCPSFLYKGIHLSF